MTESESEIKVCSGKSKPSISAHSSLHYHHGCQPATHPSFNRSDYIKSRKIAKVCDVSHRRRKSSETSFVGHEICHTSAFVTWTAYPMRGKRCRSWTCSAMVRGVSFSLDIGSKGDEETAGGTAMLQHHTIFGMGCLYPLHR